VKQSRVLHTQHSRRMLREEAVTTKAFHGHDDDFLYEHKRCPQGSLSRARACVIQNTSRMTGLENPALFAIQKASKIDRSWPPSVALEICNFLILGSPTYPDVQKSHLPVTALGRTRSLLPTSSTTVFAILIRRSQFPRARCPVSCPAAQSRHGVTPLLPTIEFA